MPTRPLVVAALAACLALGPSPGAAADAQPSIEPRAEAVLKAALGKIAAAKSLTLRAEITNETPLPSGEKIQFTGALSIAMRRPDRLRVAFDGEQRSTRSYYDGKSFTLLSTNENAYASCAAPDSLEGLFPTMREKLGFTPPLSLLLRENVVENALARTKSGYSVGRVLLRGVPAEHLAFRGEKVDWQLWVAADGEPVILRLVIVFREAPGSPQYTASFESWDFNPQFGDADFVFSAPAGAVLCEFEGLTD